MTKQWKTYEKALSAFLIVWAILLIAIQIWAVCRMIEVTHLTWNEISILKIIQNYHHTVLLGVFTITSSYLLLKNKLIGWITSTTCLISGGISLLIILWDYRTKENEVLEYKNEDFAIIAIAIVFFLFSFSMFSKPFLKKHSPTLKSFGLIILLSLILIADKLLILK